MFDYGDLITYVLIVLKRSNVSLSDDDDASLEIKEIVKRAVAGQSVPVRLASGEQTNCNNEKNGQDSLILALSHVNMIAFSQLSDLSRKNPFYSILPETTLLSVVEEFACGTHRGRRWLTKFSNNHLTSANFLRGFSTFCLQHSVAVTKPDGDIQVYTSNIQNSRLLSITYHETPSFRECYHNRRSSIFCLKTCITFPT
jgi:hypothetical protein